MGAFFVPKIRGHILVAPRTNRAASEAYVDTTANGAAEAVKTYFGALPLNTNLINLPAKVATYAVSSTTAAAQIIPALPSEFANRGVLEVLHSSTAGGGYRLFRFTTIGGSNRGVHEIELQEGVFTSWRRTDHHEVSESGSVRTVPNGTNIDTLIRSGGEFDGEWITFTDAVTANITGLPEGETSLFHLRVSGGTGFQEIQFYQGGLYWRPVINAATGGFGPWVRLDQSGGTAPTVEDVSAERMVRTSRAKQRVGGKIGTSGLPAFALRFDDWADDLNATVMPELDSRNLPAGWAATVAYVESPSQGNAFTWPGVADWVRRGMEIMGHSWSHVNASGVANIRHEIIDSADYIETQVPAAAIDTWTMPGTSAGANTYDGFGIGDKLANYYSTPAGRFILQRYPVVGGAITGRFLPLVGEPSIGRVHLTIDTLDAPTVIAEMVKARDAGVGYQLMCHPIHIGKADKITVADFQLILDWLATERDEGRIEVLTPRGLAFADKSSNEWLSLVPGVDQWTGWNNRTDWTESAGVLTTTTGGVMVRGINMTNYGNFRGGIVEIVARVRTPTGAVVQTGITGGAERIVDHTLPASTDWKWVRTVATIPNNLSDSASLVASIGRVSGGQVDIDLMAVRPV